MPHRLASGNAAGRRTKRPMTIAAWAVRVAGTETPARRRNTRKKTAPAPWAKAWMPECTLTRLIASFRKNAMGWTDENGMG